MGVGEDIWWATYAHLKFSSEDVVDSGLKRSNKGDLMEVRVHAPRFPGNKDVLTLLQESEFHVSGMAGIIRFPPGNVSAAAAAAGCRCITHLGQINYCEEPEKLHRKSTTAAGGGGLQITGRIKAGGTSDDAFSSSSHAVVPPRRCCVEMEHPPSGLQRCCSLREAGCWPV